MRKMIWRSSTCAFVPVLAGLLATPLLGMQGWWSLAAGGAVAAFAFGSFLDLAHLATSQTTCGAVTAYLVPILALSVVGTLGAVSLDMLTRHLLRPETFVSGLLAGTLFCQCALMMATQRVSVVRD